jgi:hypothetical protein
MAGGGRVSGPGSGTSDSIPARLSHGEFVTKAAQVSKYLPLLQHINNDTLRESMRFAMGGPVLKFAAGGSVGSVLKFAMGGPVGFDDGGFVSPDMAYTPAASDFGSMSTASDQIANNAASARAPGGGDTHNWSIDARGSNDPAQTIAHLDRYMRQAAPQIGAAAIRGIKDQQLRRAPSAR